MEQDFHEFLNEQFSDRIIESHPSIMMTGGAAELPLQYYMTNFTDIDVMCFYDVCCAMWPGANSPADFYKSVYTIEIIPEYPGYANLRHGTDLIGKRNIFVNFEWPISGPASRFDFVLGKFLNANEKVDLELMEKAPLDIVSSIYSPYWPPQANEWVTRKRNYGWPSKELISQVVKGGCHFVAKPHPKCPNSEEMFRFSFSRAEVILINTWNQIQKYVYHVIRLVKKYVESECRRDGRETVLCTYHFKTLLLWACEEKPPEFWNHGNLENCLQQLIYQMIEWLIDKRCPSYFLLEYNLFDHLPEDFDFEKEVNILNFFGEQISQKLMSVPIVDPNLKVTFQINNRILVFFYLLLFKQFSLRNPNQSDWIINSFNVKEFPLISLEFRKLYRGIVDHLRAVRQSWINTSAVQSEIGSRALKFLREAFRDDYGVSQIASGLGKTFSDYLEDSLLACSVKVLINPEDHSFEKSLNNDAASIQLSPPSNDLMSLSYTKEDISGSSMHSDFGVTLWNRPVQRDVPEMLLESIFPESYGEQQTENQAADISLLQSLHDFANDHLPKASYFVSAAYLANFYYTFQKKYDLALAVCKEALTKAEKLFKSMSQRFFFDRKCFVILTSKLMPIFDGPIQVVFGFVMLTYSIKCRHEKNSKLNARKILNREWSRDWLTEPPLLVVHRLHPCHFLQYIAFRVGEKTGDWKTAQPLIDIECYTFRMARILEIAIDTVV